VILDLWKVQLKRFSSLFSFSISFDFAFIKIITYLDFILQMIFMLQLFFSHWMINDVYPEFPAQVVIHADLLNFL
jgi:hypothetical protein